MDGNKNNQSNPKPKKKINSTLIIQIIGCVMLAACIGYMIYQVVLNDYADLWLPIISLVIAVLLGFSFFGLTFIYSPKGFRNRILLYVGVFVVLCIPNLVGNIVEFYSGRAMNDASIVEIATEYSYSGACTINALAEIMTFAFLSALILVVVEMLIRDSLKKTKAE